MLPTQSLLIIPEQVLVHATDLDGPELFHIFARCFHGFHGIRAGVRHMGVLGLDILGHPIKACATPHKAPVPALAHTKVPITPALSMIGCKKMPFNR